jgi:integrase
VRLLSAGRSEARKLEEGKAPKSINNYLTILRRTLSIARKWGRIEFVPGFDWMKAPKPEFDFLDFEEAERLVSAADGEWKTMVLVALRTGLRLGELRALRWQDVDLVAGRLRVRQAVAEDILGTPKSGRAREVPLSPETVKALKTHRHLRGEYVFCTDAGGCFGRMRPSIRCGGRASGPGSGSSAGT